MEKIILDNLCWVVPCGMVFGMALLGISATMLSSRISQRLGE